MNKSEKYTYAMLAVVESKLDPTVKLEVLELLSDNRNVAKWCEEQEAEKLG